MADGDIDLYADVDEDFASEEIHEDESLLKDEIVDKIEDDYKGIDYMIRMFILHKVSKILHAFFEVLINLL